MNCSIDKDSNRTLTLILYILYIVAIFSGGLLAVIALIINYVKRSDVRGSIFESHFTWQIRSFWWYLFWNIVAFVPFLFLFLPMKIRTCLQASLLVHLLSVWLWSLFPGSGLSSRDSRHYASE